MNKTILALPPAGANGYLQNKHLKWNDIYSAISNTHICQGISVADSACRGLGVFIAQNIPVDLAIMNNIQHVQMCAICSLRYDGHVSTPHFKETIF